jgi:hypothetical protein
MSWYFMWHQHQPPLFPQHRCEPCLEKSVRCGGVRESGTRNEGVRNKERGSQEQGTRESGTRNEGVRNKERGSQEQGTRESGTRNEGVRNEGQGKPGADVGFFSLAVEGSIGGCLRCVSRLFGLKTGLQSPPLIRVFFALGTQGRRVVNAKTHENPGCSPASETHRKGFRNS